MTHAFITSPSDLVELASHIQSTLKNEKFICTLPANLELITQAELVYFVVSQRSMCSSSFQQLVLDAFPLIDASRRKLLRLDDVQIPVGFNMLQSVPTSDL